MLLAPEQIEGRAAEAAARLDGEALAAARHEWDSRMEEIEMKRSRTVGALRSRVRSDLPSRFEQAIAEHCNELRDALAAGVDLCLAGRPKKPVTAQDLSELPGRAGGVADERRGQWLSAHQGEIVEALWTFASEPVDRVQRLYDEALKFAARLSGTHPPAARWTVDKNEAGFSWRTPIPFEWHPRFAWELDVFSPKWVRRKVLRYYRRTLEFVLVAYRERFAQDLAAAGDEWVSRLTSQVKDSLRDLDGRMKAALSGETVSGLSGDPNVLLSRLEEMRQELTGKSRCEPARLHAVRARSAIIRQCLVCERIEAELFDFFARGQFEAPMNKAEHPADAPIGRLCPLHTWQYAEMSSAREISLLYAPLLAATARGLRSIAISASSANAIVDRVRNLYSEAVQCLACRKVVETEEAAVKEFRQISFEGDVETGGGLCVRHLGVVLRREADLETARNIVFEEADVLDRISEDMQIYTLKRDAVRRELVTDEELTAYRSGLSLLVGYRKLSTA
jgi:hypothetical protein